MVYRHSTEPRTVQRTDIATTAFATLTKRQDLALTHLRLLVGLDVDNSLLPLAGGDLALEQNIDLAVRTALHLRQEEVCDDETEETSASPDITALSTEVGLLRCISIVLVQDFKRKKLTFVLSM